TIKRYQCSAHISSQGEWVKRKRGNFSLSPFNVAGKATGERKKRKERGPDSRDSEKRKRKILLLFALFSSGNLSHATFTR
ncbi:MAG: hypothetical protein ACE5KJ_07680, partial [Candidatus Zixiibacteriota bacterium]